MLSMLVSKLLIPFLPCRVPLTDRTLRETAVEPKDYLLVLSAYANGKEKKGKSSAEVSAKLDHLERKLMEHRVSLSPPSSSLVSP